MIAEGTPGPNAADVSLAERLAFERLLGDLSALFFENENAFALVEEWASQAELDRYLASDACKTLIAGIEMSAEPPTIRFDRVTQRGGIEVIEAARRAQGCL